MDRRGKGGRDPWDDPFFTDIGSMHEMMRRQMDEMMERFLRDVPADGRVHGYRVEMRPDGEMRRESIGGPVNEPEEALVDVREDGDRVTVIMEAPGCTSEDVDLRVSSEAISVTKDGRTREVSLPSRVDPESAEARFNNGVLTLRLRRIGPSEWRQVELG